MHKRLLSIFVLLVFIFTLSGCFLFPGKSSTKAKKIPSDTEVIEEVTEGKIDSTVTEEDEDELELKHLKNAAPVEEKKSTTAGLSTAASDNNNEPSKDPADQTTADQVAASAPVPYKPDYTIHFLSEQEVKMINEKLNKLGYLKEPAKTDKEFADAVYCFQQAEKIPGSGEINPETFERLRNK